MRSADSAPAYTQYELFGRDGAGLATVAAAGRAGLDISKAYDSQFVCQGLGTDLVK